MEGGAQPDDVVMHNSHLANVRVPGLHSTSVPIREQLRCKRWWFYYHDIRAFTTSVSI